MKFNRIVLFLSFLSLIMFSNCNSAPIPTKQKAKQAPQWVVNGIMYQIQPRAFTPEGTLKAATSQLKSVAELGVTIVYLCPVFSADDNADTLTWSPRQRASKMNNPKNPYRMKDFYHVDVEYGTDQDLQNFVAEAHRLDMKVMFDMVYFHCGSSAVFLKENPDFIRRNENGNPITGKWNWPEMNYENPELREYLIRNMKYFVNDFDVDGFRCDVAYRMPIDFWEAARERLERIRPDIGMLSEGERFEDQLKAFDLNYSFTWFKSIKRVYNGFSPAADLQKTWEKMKKNFPTGSRFIRYIDNHDIANDSYHNRIDKAWGFSGVNAAMVMNFTIDGVPFLYNGQEVADTARHSIFGKAPIDWERKNTITGQMRFKFLQKLCGIYKREVALTKGEMLWLENNKPNSVLSYLRKSGNVQILTVINISNHPVSVKIECSEYFQDSSLTPILEKGVISGNFENGFEIQPYGFWVGK